MIYLIIGIMAVVFGIAIVHDAKCSNRLDEIRGQDEVVEDSYPENEEDWFV